jgi:hypothetical protein
MKRAPHFYVEPRRRKIRSKIGIEFLAAKAKYIQSPRLVLIVLVKRILDILTSRY